MKLFRRDLKGVISSVLIALTLVLAFPTRAANASLYLSPSSGQVTAGQAFSLALRVNTGGVAINAAEGSLVFDAAKLSVSSISKSSSVFSIWAEEPSFSNAEGTIEFAGGIPNPGYSGSNGLVLTINFRAKTATTVRGSTEISLVSGAILANDGYGTNILASLGKAVYSILPSSSTPSTEEDEPQPVVSISAPKIRSTTHPDENKWYSSKDPVFKWEVPSGVSEVLLVLSQRSNSPPTVRYAPAIAEKQLTDIDDGSWYLNARFRSSGGLGSIDSFKFNVDTAPPTSFEITRVDTDDPTNPRPELLFESSDVTSGIERYEMKIGDREWLKIEPALVGEAYAIPLQKYGTHTIEVKAFDAAGNSTSAKTEIKIEPIKAPVITEFTKEAGSDQPIVVKGRSEANSKILVEITKNGPIEVSIAAIANAKKVDEGHYIFESSSDESGDWSAEIEGLPAGYYKIFARTQDQRGAISELSNEVETRIRGGILDQISKWIDAFINFLSNGGLVIVLIGLIIGLVVALIELFRIKSKKWFKPFVDWLVLRKVQKKSDEQIVEIIKDIEQEIKFLRMIGKRRRLGPEENYLKSKLEQYIKSLRSYKS